MALYINNTERPYHLPLRNMLDAYRDDLTAIEQLQLDSTELDAARKLYPHIVPTTISVVVLHGDFARNVLSALMYYGHTSE